MGILFLKLKLPLEDIPIQKMGGAYSVVLTLWAVYSYDTKTEGSLRKEGFPGMANETSGPDKKHKSALPEF